MTDGPLRRTLIASVFACCAILFSLFTVFVQVTDLSLQYLETDQLYRHTRVIHGHAGNPYQYRILSEYLVHGMVLALTSLQLPNPIVTGFILFRVLQNAVLFLLAAAYYRALGLSSYVTLLGMSILAWGVSRSGYDSDLSFNLYSDVIFYLAAGLAIVSGHRGAILPITVFAALNRETSGLIPAMALAPSAVGMKGLAVDRRDAFIALSAAALYGAVFVGLRSWFGAQPLILAYGNQLGLELLTYNLFRLVTWAELFGTLGIIPILGVWAARSWPRHVRVFFWAVVPVWLTVHLFASVMAEARLFLVPFALVFVPGALFGLMAVNRESSGTVGPELRGETGVQAAASLRMK